MQNLLPVLLCLVVPIIWTIIIFAAGRWSASHTISITRRGETVGPSPFYDNFQEG